MSELLSIKFYSFGKTGAVIMTIDNTSEQLLTKEMIADDKALAYFVREAIKQTL